MSSFASLFLSFCFASLTRISAACFAVAPGNDNPCTSVDVQQRATTGLTAVAHSCSVLVPKHFCRATTGEPRGNASMNRDQKAVAVGASSGVLLMLLLVWSLAKAIVPPAIADDSADRIA